MSGAFYAPGETDHQILLAAAIARLGLNDLDPFDPGKKIIEEQL
jgi:hypothetical protein